MNNNLALFEEKQIRKTWNDSKWYFSVEDVVYALTDSKDIRQYIKKLKSRDIELQNNWGTICTPLQMIAKDGKRRKILMADTEQILRIIQSIPSPKAEPFKRWLAKIGSERIEEINNPELAMDRMKEIYERKGYSKSWIEQREKGIIARHNLTDEWKERGVKPGRDYAILTNEIYKSGFGYTAKEYKNLKGLHESQNLRDSMTNLELALTNLGEVTAVVLHKKNDSNGIKELKGDMNTAGKVINTAKQRIETELGTSLVTKDSYKDLTKIQGVFMEKYKDVEKSIIKKYRKEIWSKFVKAVQEYELIKENDNIMVCISGGKDSFLLAKCFQEIIKHGKFKFNAYYVVMNPGYKQENLELIKKNALELNIPIEIFESDIFEVVDKVSSESPCYLCARMRRGFLYSKAKELGCNKIALGHHFDDVIETTLLSMFYGSEIKTMMPKLHSTNFEGLELIRPLYLVKEEDIISWSKSNELTFLNCACKFTEKNSNDFESNSKRKEIKQLIKDLKKVNKNIDHNIFKSLDNVNLNCVLGTTKNGNKKSFLEDYNK